MAKILIIEDEKNLSRFVELELQHENYETVVENNGRKGLEDALSQDFDAILLDLMLPDLNGLEIARRVRQVKTTPIIMMTARDSVIDRVSGLDHGADDYIVKPFGTMELISRIKALLRRAKSEQQSEYTIEKLYVNPSKHIVTVGGANVMLTLKEFEMLCLMLKKRGTVFSRDRLLEEIWGYDYDGENRTVDVHIRTLRAKLGECGDLIETVRGIGYKIG